MRKIVCFHLLNDYSGSPKVLRMVLQGLLGQNNKIDLVTSNGNRVNPIFVCTRIFVLFLISLLVSSWSIILYQYDPACWGRTRRSFDGEASGLSLS